jgi:hypothetical protein
VKQIPRHLLTAHCICSKCRFVGLKRLDIEIVKVFYLVDIDIDRIRVQKVAGTS